MKKKGLCNLEQWLTEGSAALLPGYETEEWHDDAGDGDDCCPDSLNGRFFRTLQRLDEDVSWEEEEAQEEYGGFRGRLDIWSLTGLRDPDDQDMPEYETETAAGDRSSGFYENNSRKLCVCKDMAAGCSCDTEEAGHFLKRCILAGASGLAAEAALFLALGLQVDLVPVIAPAFLWLLCSVILDGIAEEAADLWDKIYAGPLAGQEAFYGKIRYRRENVRKQNFPVCLDDASGVPGKRKI